MCANCIHNTGTYNMDCIGCMARHIKTLTGGDKHKNWVIRHQTKHDVEALKAEVKR